MIEQWRIKVQTVAPLIVLIFWSGYFLFATSMTGHVTVNCRDYPCIVCPSLKGTARDALNRHAVSKFRTWKVSNVAPVAFSLFKHFKQLDNI